MPCVDAPTPSDTDHEALLRLIASGGSARTRRALLDAHGDPVAALAAGYSAWRAAGLDPRQVAALRHPDGAALHSARDWLAAPGHQLIGWHDSAYPPLLRRIASPPLALFVAGDATMTWRPAVAVVGSRAATATGREHAAGFASAIARAGLVVASGLASGIDAAAHRAALAAGAGTTVAVLGCGPDIAYPATHAGLLGEVAASGAVVSEHLPGIQPRREFFPSRNRILAGLSLATLVVEAGERSGALITARQAADAGREVFAIPGSIRSPLSRGCHRLIRDGAGLVESPAELLDVLAPLAVSHAGALRRQLEDPIQAPVGAEKPGPCSNDADYKRLWSTLSHDPSPMDALVERSGLTPAELSSMLLVMELEGRVVVEHGRYSRK
jgi:DNA processing protein